MVLFFLGGYSILLGISFLRDMILWKNIMGNTYLWYYIEFAFIDAPVFLCRDLPWYRSDCNRNNIVFTDIYIYKKMQLVRKTSI